MRSCSTMDHLKASASPAMTDQLSRLSELATQPRLVQTGGQQMQSTQQTNSPCGQCQPKRSAKPKLSQSTYNTDWLRIKINMGAHYSGDVVVDLLETIMKHMRNVPNSDIEFEIEPLPDGTPWDPIVASLNAKTETTLRKQAKRLRKNARRGQGAK